LNESFRRRKGKVQPISLIERVNRSVSPELEGITLARMVEGWAVKLVSPSLRLACDFQRVNFEVVNLKPFACLAFPLSHLRENALKQPGFGDELVTSFGCEGECYLVA
jgi:hypothetical protein